MNILIFEYVTGGGFCGQPLPSSLANEGERMLKALLANFDDMPTVQTMTMLDHRFFASPTFRPHASSTQFLPVPDNEDVAHLFQAHLQKVDAAWVIAPEFDRILETFCLYVTHANKILLTSPAEAVRQTANKFETFQRLQQAKIVTVPTEYFDPNTPVDKSKEWIIKPIDGAGAQETYLLCQPDDWNTLPPILPHQFICQPHIQGEKTSLSCLFDKQNTRLLCINLQMFDLINQRFYLKNIKVNYKNDDGRYNPLVSNIASAFPDLWGYVGIDLIETPDEIYVLEINPRLTTSFVSIQAKVGLNIANLVLDLLPNKSLAHNPQ